MDVCLSCPDGCSQCDHKGMCYEFCSDQCADCLLSPYECLVCNPDKILNEGFTPVFYYPYYAYSYSSSADGSSYYSYYYPTHYSKMCLTDCSSELGLFYNSTSNTCQPCMSNCDICSDKITCDQCSYGYYSSLDMYLNQTVCSYYCN